MTIGAVTHGEIIYSREGEVSAGEFQAVLVESGLGAIRPVDDPGRLQRMLDNADVVVTARLPRQGNRMIGLARAVTDFSWCCYLSDLAVVQDMKGLGVGRGLLDHLRQLLGPEVSLFLVSVPEAVPFYERAGMLHTPDCFSMRRER